jgi:hypothetical protein
MRVYGDAAGVHVGVRRPLPAQAPAEPFAFGEARRGNLQVISSAFVTGRAADLRGVRLNESRPCNVSRTLRVNALIDYSRGSTTKRVTRRKTGAVQNCGEGGPNFGFTIRAPRVRLACPSGRWKPGFYTFVVRSTHRASGAQATVSLAWANRRRC